MAATGCNQWNEHDDGVFVSGGGGGGSLHFPVQNMSCTYMYPQSQKNPKITDFTRTMNMIAILHDRSLFSVFALQFFTFFGHIFYTFWLLFF